jgi:hypothetical protein
MRKSVLLLLLVSVYAYCADRFKVQVVESSSMTTIAPTGAGTGKPLVDIFAKVILPNGDHASLMCAEKRCALIEPIAPEKMSPTKSEDCYTLGSLIFHPIAPLPNVIDRAARNSLPQQPFDVVYLYLN